MSGVQTETRDESVNPLDSLEEALALQEDWFFTRPVPEELTVHIDGQKSTYALTFVWQEEAHALQMYCDFNFSIPDYRRSVVLKVLEKVNGAMWLGHFDVPENSGIPCFRHTGLMHGWNPEANLEFMEDLVDVAVTECDRHFGTFNLLTLPIKLEDAALDLVLCEPAGRA